MKQEICRVHVELEDDDLSSWLFLGLWKDEWIFEKISSSDVDKRS